MGGSFSVPRSTDAYESLSALEARLLTLAVLLERELDRRSTVKEPVPKARNKTFYKIQTIPL